MNCFKSRSGSDAIVKSADYIKQGTYVPQAHDRLNRFKSNVIKYDIVTYCILFGNYRYLNIYSIEKR